MDSDKNIQFPANFICPISQTVMKDPVMTVDGHTFERKTIQEWFSKTKKGKPKNPMTNLELKSKTLYPNHALKSAIQEFKGEIAQKEKESMEKKNLLACLKVLEEMQSQEITPGKEKNGEKKEEVNMNEKEIKEKEKKQEKEKEKEKEEEKLDAYIKKNRFIYFKECIKEEKQVFDKFKENFTKYKEQLKRNLQKNENHFSQFKMGCYIGQMKDRKREGYGVMHYKDQAKYEGQWKKNKKSGFGIYSYSNGNLYQGEWKHDERHGRGTLFYADGHKYEGNWKHNEQSGLGTFHDYESVCECYWRSNERDGIGRVQLNNGIQKYCEWEEDMEKEEENEEEGKGENKMYKNDSK